MESPEQALTPREALRFRELGERRRPSFLAARLALKELASTVGSVEAGADPRTLETIHSDGPLPRLPFGTHQEQDRLHCSVAHDRRFAVAVAARHPVGVDVEATAPRLERVSRLLVNPREMPLLSSEPSRRLLDLARLWTLKEAACKALGLPLLRGLGEVILTRPGKRRSRFMVGDLELLAHHDSIDDHVFSLVCLHD